MALDIRARVGYCAWSSVAAVVEGLDKKLTARA
jgi:hypothetical protein